MRYGLLMYGVRQAVFLNLKLDALLEKSDLYSLYIIYRDAGRNMFQKFGFMLPVRGYLVKLE